MCKYLSRATYFRTTRTISLLELFSLGAENGRANLRSVKRKSLAAVGFEPTPPRRLVPKTSALDRSATLPHKEETLINITNP